MKIIRHTKLSWWHMLYAPSYDCILFYNALICFYFLCCRHSHCFLLQVEITYRYFVHVDSNYTTHLARTWMAEACHRSGCAFLKYKSGVWSLKSHSAIIFLGFPGCIIVLFDVFLIYLFFIIILLIYISVHIYSCTDLEGDWTLYINGTPLFYLFFVTF